MSGIVEYITRWMNNAKDEEKAQEVEYFNLNEQMKSSARDIEAFLFSPIWHDIEHTIKGKILTYRNALEVTSNHNEIIHMQGEIYSLRTVLLIPVKMLEMLHTPNKEDDDNA